MAAAGERSRRERHACVFAPSPEALALSGTPVEGALARPSAGTSLVEALALSTDLYPGPVYTPQRRCALANPPLSLAGPERVMLRSVRTSEFTPVDLGGTTLHYGLCTVVPEYE